MSSRLTIRRLTPEDWALYRDIRLRSLADSPTAFGTTYSQAIQNGTEIWRTRLVNLSPVLELPLLAEVNDVAAGLVWGKVLEPERPLAHLFQMWVAPEYRGMQIGRALLQRAIAWARESGMHMLQLQVTLGNEPAEALYRSAGFVPCGEPEPLRGGSELRSISMELRLT